MSLEARHLAIAYGDATAVWDASLEVADAEIVSVIGPNGAGKTTLINAISGLTPLSAGAIRLGGMALAGLPPHRIAALVVASTFPNVHLFGGLPVADSLTVH